MLFYGDIVKKALNDEALPILRDAVDTALTARFGEEWYNYFARAILEGYSEFKQVDAAVAGSKGKAVDALDINAICYLVMPYDKDLKMYLDGAMPMIEEKFGLEPKPERLKRIRTIYNNVARGKFDADMEESDSARLSGEQEKKWLADIEATLQEFKPELSLESYSKELEEQIARKAEVKEKLDEALSKRPTTEEVRESYTKIWQFHFSDAPIAKGMTGKAPWAVLNEDLEHLPWPSEAGKQPAGVPMGAVTEEFAEVVPGHVVGGAAAASAIAAASAAGMPGSAPMQVNLEEFLKPAPDKSAKKIPGTAPNEGGAEEAAPAEEAADKKGKGKLFGWFKGKK